MSKFTKSEYRWLAAQRWRIWCPSSSQRCTDTSRSQQKSGWKTSAHLYHTRKHTTQTCTWAKEDLRTATVKPSWDIILPSFTQHVKEFLPYIHLYTSGWKGRVSLMPHSAWCALSQCLSSCYWWSLPTPEQLEKYNGNHYTLLDNTDRQVTELWQMTYTPRRARPCASPFL